MARRKNHPGEDSAAAPFEEALARLEAIVEAMEHEQLPLEELVASYEAGSALLERCETILQSARGRIELITLRGKPGDTGDRSPGDGVESSPPSGAPDDSEQDDDIRLF